ncbi:MAG: hypothetical protein RRY36_10455, partial [Bacteroidaceae bacterium]
MTSAKFSSIYKGNSITNNKSNKESANVQLSVRGIILLVAKDGCSYGYDKNICRKYVFEVIKKKKYL